MIFTLVSSHLRCINFFSISLLQFSTPHFAQQASKKLKGMEYELPLQVLNDDAGNHEDDLPREEAVEAPEKDPTKCIEGKNLSDELELVRSYSVATFEFVGVNPSLCYVSSLQEHFLAFVVRKVRGIQAIDIVTAEMDTLIVEVKVLSLSKTVISAKNYCH